MVHSLIEFEFSAWPLQSMEQLVLVTMQGMIARAMDTDCEYCLDTRRKLFGFFKAAEKEAGSKKASE